MAAPHVTSPQAPPPPRRARNAGDARLRSALWMLHIPVTTLAVLSLVTRRFDLWIDLRAMGNSAVLLEILWVAATVLVPFCAGPRLAGFFQKPRWAPGFLPAWAHVLLWPTYIVLACLLINTVYYVQLWLQHRVDAMIPMPLTIGMLLGAWALVTREWIRRGAARESQRTSRLRQGLAAIYAAAVLLFFAAAFALHMFSRRPLENKIDLAVVLGTLVNPDGTASVQLTDRTRVAIDLYQRGVVKHILLSGGIHPPRTTGGPALNEISAMKQVCLKAGIPEQALLYDPVGVNTRATAANTRLLMQHYGYSSVVACSTDFHLFRTVGAFRESGITAYALPAKPTDWQCAQLRDTLRELAAIAVYTLDPHYRQPKVITMQLASPRVVVRKSAGTLDLFDGATLVKTYACISGGTPGDKAVEGDRKTPEGHFHIVYKNPESKFHLSMGIDYPTREDAQRGLAQGLITPQQYDGILAALTSDLSQPENQRKLWYTPLGGEIFLHGFGEGRTGTAGCVALSNLDIEELYAIVPLGTPVEIKP